MIGSVVLVEADADVGRQPVQPPRVLNINPEVAIQPLAKGERKVADGHAVGHRPATAIAWRMTAFDQPHPRCCDSVATACAIARKLPGV